MDSLSSTDAEPQTRIHQQEAVPDLGQSLSGRAFVVALVRNDSAWVPDSGECREVGKRVTLLGESEAVEAAASDLSARLSSDTEEFGSAIREKGQKIPHASGCIFSRLQLARTIGIDMLFIG